MHRAMTPAGAQVAQQLPVHRYEQGLQLFKWTRQPCEINLTGTCAALCMDD